MGAQPLAQIVQILVPQDLAALVDDAVAVEEVKGRGQTPIVDELRHGVQLIQAVLQRRAGQHQREGRLQALDDVAGLGLPVLDALALVQDDQVPLDSFDGQDVAEHLFVIADREERVVAVLGARSAAPPMTNWQERSENLRDFAHHWDLTEAGRRSARD
jgi:hypothetical protein